MAYIIIAAISLAAGLAGGWWFSQKGTAELKAKLIQVQGQLDAGLNKAATKL